jgi:hypothetical protein
MMVGVNTFPRAFSFQGGIRPEMFSSLNSFRGDVLHFDLHLQSETEEESSEDSHSVSGEVSK